MIECTYTSETKITSMKFNEINDAIKWLKNIETEDDKIENVIIPEKEDLMQFRRKRPIYNLPNR